MKTSTKARVTRRQPLRWLAHSDLVPVGLSALIATAVAFAFLQSPATVDSVSVSNPSDYNISVQVRGVDGGWMPLTTVPEHQTKATRDVIDQGDSWTFRFAAQGRSGGQVRIDRTALEAAGWTIQMPDHVIEQLVERGALPPP